MLDPQIHTIRRPNGRAVECFYEYLCENWPRYNGTALYVTQNVSGFTAGKPLKKYTALNFNMAWKLTDYNRNLRLS